MWRRTYGGGGGSSPCALKVITPELDKSHGIVVKVDHFPDASPSRTRQMRHSARVAHRLERRRDGFCVGRTARLKDGVAEQKKCHPRQGH